MPRRFGTFPAFATAAPGNTGVVVTPAVTTASTGGVILDTDTRLGGAVSDIPNGQRFLLPPNRQHVAFTRVLLDGTLVLDGTLIMF